MVLSLSWALAQNGVKTKLIIPVKYPGLNLLKTEKANEPFSANKLYSPAEPATIFESLISNLPLINLREFSFKKTTLFTTEFSLNDMLENTLNSVSQNVINTYDDHISELFKEAPSLFKLKCIIEL